MPSPSFTATMQKSPLVAVDTNFPLLLANGNHDALDALAIVRQRVRPVEILIPPTVLGELRYQAESDPDRKQRELARHALTQLRPQWHFHPADLNSAQEAIVAEAARRTLIVGLLPQQERNDAAIIAESAVLNSILLVSNDSHLLQIDHRRLGLLFRELDLPVPLIVSPREIVNKFYR
jgi:predicted nucleic acid-binding protein